jgi:hypothetical protein
LIGKLRLLCTFGVTTLKDEDAIRLSTILNKMKFSLGDGPRTERLTTDQVRQIRAKAHEVRWHSLALVQALQHDFTEEFRQADIIGEWVPIGEPGASDIIRAEGREKWLRGLKWSEIDDRLILRHHVATGRKNEQTLVEVNLRRGHMVMEEIERISPRDRVGPLAICEMTGVPWTGSDFRRRWRQIANMVGVPKNIRNSDVGRMHQDEGKSKLEVLS